MDRLACVDVPAFPLQLLIRRHPGWVGHPVAVVTHDAPQGVILWVNDEARARCILPGMRYAAGLSLSMDLRAGEVSEDEIAHGVTELTVQLQDLTPRVEPAHGEAGVFWLDASGLEKLHGSIEAWTSKVINVLAGYRLTVRLVVGFTRFGSYALARAATTPISVLASRKKERTKAERVSLDLLGIEPRFREALTRLGIRTVRGLLDLPAGGLLERFGPDAYRLHHLAADNAWEPLRPEPLGEPVEMRTQLEHPTTDSTQLIFLVKRLLHPLLAQLAERCEALAKLQLDLNPDNAGPCVLTVQPAAPTLDALQVLDLVRLRLEATRLSAGVEELLVRAVGVLATPELLQLFAEHPCRDLQAAERAFARIRAEFGAYAVVRAQLRDKHLPEASFTWEPFKHACLPQPHVTGRDGMRLVRRIQNRPLMLPPCPRHEPNGWLVRGLKSGPVMRCVGPFEISGGWWSGAEVHREYHFLQTQNGELLWVFYDRRRNHWFLQGWVE